MFAFLINMFFLLIGCGTAAVTYYITAGTDWSWMTPVMLWVGMFAATKLYKKSLYHHPRFMQRPVYRLWKESILETGNRNPLMGYPLAIFIELELDGIFEREGLRAAETAFMAKVESVGKGLTDFVDQVAARRASQLEKKA